MNGKVHGTHETNGHGATEEDLQNGEYSADDDELLDGMAQKDDSEDDQPSVTVRPSVTPTPVTNESRRRISNRSASKTSSIAKAKAALTEVRQRFTGNKK